MSAPATKRKQSKSLRRNQDDVLERKLDQNAATTFALWYKRMMDHDRYSIGPYLDDEVVFHGFGRKIKTRKKVTDYLKYAMDATNHEFTSIEHRDKINYLDDNRTLTDERLASPPSKSPEITRKRTVKNLFMSPEEINSKLCETDTKRHRGNNYEETTVLNNSQENLDISDKGDGIIKKRKFVAVTPNKEHGQGDVLPSKSGSSDSKTDVCHSHLYVQLAQLPRKAIECNGYVEFTKNHGGAKWERKCKLQVSYSEDPFHIGEYIIWGIYYTSESTCRKNLLPLFEKCD